MVSAFAAVAATPACGGSNGGVAPEPDEAGVDAAAPANEDGGTPDGGSSCTGSLRDCNGDRKDGCEVDLQADGKNCSACGKACGPQEVCNAGSCTSACDPGKAVCSGGCVDTTTAPLHCGSCGNACAQSQFGAPKCEGGKCSLTCNPGYNLCNGKCVPDDPSACGASCKVCPTDTLGFTSCQQGACYLSCQSGYAKCAAGCVPDSPTQCGATCAACPTPPNGAAACAIGACNFTCNAGYVKCPGAAASCCALSTFTASHVAASPYHTCAVTSGAQNGRVKCWGYNYGGQLLVSTATRSRPWAETLVGQNGVASLGGMIYSQCERFTNGAVSCWGTNNVGQLGDGTKVDRASPVPVVGIANAISLGGVTEGNMCALLGTGELKCWGYNGFGQLGNGGVIDAPTPITPAGMGANVTAFATGNGMTCAVVAGAAKCWGENGDGRLGDNSKTNRTSPVGVFGLGSGVLGISALEAHACVVMTDGRVKCWGRNTAGQLGNGSKTATQVPVDVAGITTATAVSVGFAHSCALLANGTITCWGKGGAGALGTGSFADLDAPGAPVQGITTATAISSGNGHVCALLSDATLRCWGGNVYGQLGDNTTDNRSSPVTPLGL